MPRTNNAQPSGPKRSRKTYTTAEIAQITKKYSDQNGNIVVPTVTEDNLEERTSAAAILYSQGLYKSMRRASRIWTVPYHRLRNRVGGRKSIKENGGLNCKLSPVETIALLFWLNRQVALGIHVHRPALAKAANEVLHLNNNPKSATKRWAGDWLHRHRDMIAAPKDKSQAVAAESPEAVQGYEMVAAQYVAGLMEGREAREAARKPGKAKEGTQGPGTDSDKEGPDLNIGSDKQELPILQANVEEEADQEDMSAHLGISSDTSHVEDL